MINELHKKYNFPTKINPTRIYKNMYLSQASNNVF